MLPFLKKAPSAGVIVTTRQPDEQKDSEDHGLRQCAKELIDAVHTKDEAAVARAIRAAFEILDSEPHEEGPHTNEKPSPHTYEAQNVKE